MLFSVKVSVRGGKCLVRLINFSAADLRLRINEMLAILGCDAALLLSAPECLGVATHIDTGGDVGDSVQPVLCG
jgi:hypothetical protein